MEYTEPDWAFSFPGPAAGAPCLAGAAVCPVLDRELQGAPC